MRQALELIVEQIINGVKSPLEGHPDLGPKIGGGISDGSLEYTVLSHSSRIQRGYPEKYATIVDSLPEELRPIAEYAEGTRYETYEHIGDLAHRAGSRDIYAMAPKIKHKILRFGLPGRMSLEDDLIGQSEGNAINAIIQRERVKGNDISYGEAKDYPDSYKEIVKADMYNRLLDLTFAAMYSRIQTFTPMQAIGRNIAIAFGMRRYPLYKNLAKKLFEFLEMADRKSVDSDILYKMGFNIEGVNNLSRSNNEVAKQWEQNKLIIEKFLQNPSIEFVENLEHQLRSQISIDDLKVPMGMLDDVILEISKMVPHKKLNRLKNDIEELSTEFGIDFDFRVTEEKITIDKFNLGEDFDMDDDLYLVVNLVGELIKLSDYTYGISLEIRDMMIEEYLDSDFKWLGFEKVGNSYFRETRYESSRTNL